MSAALQALVAGLAAGAVYGLVGFGFTLVYRLARVLPFAHGDLVVGAVLSAVLAVVGSTPVAVALDPVGSVALVALAVAAGAGLSAATYLGAIRPFVGRDVTGWAVGGIAAALLVRSVLGLALPAQAYAVPDPLHLQGIVALPAGTTVPVRLLGVAAIGLAVGLAADRYVVRSRLGRAMRAVADDPEAALLVGVPVDRVRLAAFVLAGAVAGLAGLLYAPGRALAIDAGVVLGLKGAAAALIGGLGSVRGALLGGLALGVVEQSAVAAPALGAAYADVLPLALLVVVLAIRPLGFRSPYRSAVE